MKLNPKDFDFVGRASKYGVLCTDGLTIDHGAFEADNGAKVPLCWMHEHDDPEAVLGYGIITHSDEGPLIFGKFNNTKKGQHAKEAVMHGDIECLSVNAGSLKRSGSHIKKGHIKEVSLVYAGANPGALIDQTSISHGDDELFDATIYNEYDEFLHAYGDSLDELLSDISQADIQNETKTEDEGNKLGVDKTIGDVLATLNEEQSTVVYDLLQTMMNREADNETSHSDKMEDISMKMNMFENGNKNQRGNRAYQMTNEDFSEILHSAIDEHTTLSVACKNYLEAHENEILHAAGCDEEINHENGNGASFGIKDINVLFPEARNVNKEPKMLYNDMGWVSKVLGGVTKRPWSRLRSTWCDLTADEMNTRAKGYVTGNKKTEEVIGVAKRDTSATTIYKKQALNRDDIISITDFSVVAWLKREMRVKLDEEIARAIIFGDGRATSSPDKIDEKKIIPVYNDNALFTLRGVISKADTDVTVDDIIDQFIDVQDGYEGGNVLTAFVSKKLVNRFKKEKDKLGHRIYRSREDIKDALGVDHLIEVPLMKNLERELKNREADGGQDETTDFTGKMHCDLIALDLSDYSIGTDAGGEVTMFDDFDIDFNQYKYLMETRCSGMLTSPRTAMVIEHPTGLAAE